MTIQSIARKAAIGIGCDPEATWALARVESGGGKHLHRYEPHVFRRIHGSRARSYAAACDLDPEAAAQASSWGAFQVMGHWYHDLGYDSAAEMADALSDIRDTDAQAKSVVDYCTITSPPSGTALRALDAEALALSYNGPKGIERKYHVKFRAALAKAGRHSAVTLSAGDTGDAVAVLQEKLRGLGHEIKIDGHFGRKTEEAVQAVQRAKGLKIDGMVGAKTWKALGADEAVIATQAPPDFGEKAQVVIADNPGKTVGTVIIGSVLGGMKGLETLQHTLDELGIGKEQARDAFGLLRPYATQLTYAGIAAIAGLCLFIIIKDIRDGIRERRANRDFTDNLTKDFRGVDEPDDKGGIDDAGGDADIVDPVDVRPESRDGWPGNTGLWSGPERVGAGGFEWSANMGTPRSAAGQPIFAFGSAQTGGLTDE